MSSNQFVDEEVEAVRVRRTSNPSNSEPPLRTTETDHDALTTSPNSNDDNDFSILAVSLVFVVPALGGLLFGYDISASSFVLQALINTTTAAPDHWSHVVAQSAVWQGVIVSLSSAGAWVASWLVFYQNDALGRRSELKLGATLYILGASLEFASGSTLWERSYFGLSLLILGRLVYGLGIGVTMHAAPTYIGEMAPSSVRGMLVSLKEACIVLGMVLGYTVGWWYGLAWRYTYLSSIFPSITVLFLAVFIPESSRWLLLQGPVKYKHQALLSLEFVFPQGDTALRQLRAMQTTLRQEGLLEHMVRTGSTTASALLEGGEEGAPLLQSSSPGSSSLSTWQLLMQPQYRRPLVAGFGLVILQQVTGQPSVLSYATQIFAEAGVAGSAAIAVALFKLVSTLAAAATVERYGRTKLLLVGCSLMLGALLLLATSFSQTFGSSMPKLVTLVAMFAYIGGYQVGFGPITWLMTSEIFPLAIRGQAVAVAVQLNFLLNAVVQLLTPVLQKGIGLAWTFGIFALLDIYGIIFVKAHVPETKGLTLEQIEELFTLTPPQQEQDSGTEPNSTASNSQV